LNHWLVRVLIGALARVLPKLPAVKIANTALSHDSGLLDVIADDVLHHKGTLPIRFVHEFLRSGDAALASAPRVMLPTLIVHGEEDKVIPVKLGGQMTYERIGSKRKQLKVFSGW
jgi:alpha-beta hydrolase superfamily lysophospholipase